MTRCFTCTGRAAGHGTLWWVDFKILRVVGRRGQGAPTRFHRKSALINTRTSMRATLHPAANLPLNLFLYLTASQLAPILRVRVGHTMYIRSWLKQVCALQPPSVSISLQQICRQKCRQLGCRWLVFLPFARVFCFFPMI